ncbi:MAG: dethiobiotin synthase [Arcobacteraceae bacterium]|jgi:dethiobiotin synthetase|nr:dethiobiotin synthase [Arcobacteraceae bacterium]
MKEIYFITATNTDVGKTMACEIFLEKFAKKNKKVGYFKPIETGVDDIPIDGSKLLTVAKKLNSNFQVTIDDVVPLQYKLPASPFVASGGENININIIKEKMEYLLNFCDVLIVEGAGGLMVPINKNFFMIDLIKELNPTNTFLIVPSNLGSINDTLLSLNALKFYDIKHQWYINLYKDKESFTTTTFPFYKAYFDKLHFLN